MKYAYPIVMTPGEDFIIVHIPDFDISTQGVDYADAIAMARDAIGLMGMVMEDDGKKIPPPTLISEVDEDGIVSLVDIDFTEYRRKHSMKAVKKNCTIPGWLNDRAEAEGLNFSGILQAALKEKLGID